MLVVLVSFPLTTYADITVALTKGFVKKYKDRATISTSFEVDEVKWFKVKSTTVDPEKKNVKVKSGDLASKEETKANDFSGIPG